MPTIPCFFLEPTGRTRRALRRYRFDRDAEGACPVHGYHNGFATLDDIETPAGKQFIGDDWPHDDRRWPAQCDCGYIFTPADTWQLFSQEIYRRTDTGELTTLRDAQPGAMWYADWMIEEGSQLYRGPDGHCLLVRTPGGDWMIDGRASNCGRPDDDIHRCWVRHGAPPGVTVDKNGDTCQAGGGSILAGSYLGFLRNGCLVDA